MVTDYTAMTCAQDHHTKEMRGQGGGSNQVLNVEKKSELPKFM